MKAELSRHFDVVIVIWVLALAVGFSLAMVSHPQHASDQWSYQAPAQTWVFPAGN